MNYIRKSYVVPAKAGTHNPRRSRIAKGIDRNAKKRVRAVWVPAFAGTTECIPYCTISNNPAAPMPPPTHMVTTAYFALRRRPSIRA
jgi:hypothetical protein